MTITFRKARALFAGLALGSGFLAVCAGATPVPSAIGAPAAKSDAILPDRLLECVLAHPTNLDAHLDQKQSDVIYEGHHAFALLLPAIPKRTAPPPDATEPAEPVDPRTRIVFDPDHLTADVPHHFDRVVDYWPERVELTTTIRDPLSHLIIVSDINEAKGTARLFMVHATDVATMDLKHVFEGPCRIGYGKS